MQNPVSIIIPILNDWKRLELVLDALALESQQYDGEVEVIVVDNGSTDGTYELAMERSDIAIQEKSYRTPYICRNVGLKRATHNFIILLDVNCIPQHGFIEHLLKCIGGGHKIVAAKVIPDNTVNASIFERFDYINSNPREYDTNPPKALPATVLAFFRQVPQKIGLFIPDIRSLADIEWTSRAYKSGISLEVCQKATVKYRFKKFRPLIKKGRRIGGGVKARWLREHEGFGWRWPFFVGKHFFPPSFIFFKFLRLRNREDQTKLNLLQIFLIAWLFKIYIGLGLLFTPIITKVS